jgi:Ca-activated chloride channel family protein
MPAFRASLGALTGPGRRQRAKDSNTAFSLISTLAAALFAIMAAISLAGPSWGVRGAANERRGLEAAVVLDVSRSMEARDMGGLGSRAKPRLEAAKALIGSLLWSPVGTLKNGDGMGASFSLVAVKGASVLLVPMTEDLFAFEGALAYANPDAITNPGTDLEDGIRSGLASFSGNGAQGRVLFLFTDGRELSGSARRACGEAQAARARLVIVGMGGPIPVSVPGADGAPLAGAKGQVRSALDAPALKALATLAGGRYIDASEPGAGASLAAELAASMGRGTRIEYVSVDRSGLFVFLALACLLATIVAYMLSTRGARA